MGVRQILPLALCITLVAFSISGRGLSGHTTAGQLPSHPEGSDRCKGCHAAEVEGYARSAMAHSLRRARQEPAGVVTSGGATITMYSTPAGSWQRWQAGGDSSNYHVDYVIGSGKHAAGYLIDIAGHLFQSPVAFYKSRNAYDLAPGYEKTQGPDFTRPVAEGCVFCHAGNELHVAGTDNEYREPIFPDEAITCERCHGPSEKHLADPRAETIVNPAKLEQGARDSICEQCHLMGVTRVPNPGREFRDFQPGQRLETTFTTYHDALPPNAPAGEFKVISHVEQLALSQCARSSEGKLWCGTCHDPHNKPVDPVAYYRSRCLTCHTQAFPSSHPDTQSNCIGCHMPRRDAQDGGHTAFTDHRIQRRPQPQTGLSTAADIAAWREPAPELKKRNLGIAYINAGLRRRSAELMVRGYRLLTEVQEPFANDPEVFMWMGTALLVGGKSSEAQFAFERVVQLNPKSAAAETNMAAALQQSGDLPGAITHLKNAVALDPLHLSAIGSLVHLYEQQGDAPHANELSQQVRKLIDESSSTSVPMFASMPAPKMAETVYKNIQFLKGMPADQVIPGMRVISSALGVQCNFCHVEGHFDDDAKRPKQTARSMMRMMSVINQNNFAGIQQVTCFSCHRGSPKPEGIPTTTKETPATTMEASAKDNSPELLPTLRELLDHYIQAVGGSGALEKITARIETGIEENRGNSMPIEIFAQGPDRWTAIEHAPSGESMSILNGTSGFTKIPGHAPRAFTETEAEYARVEADLQFPLHIEQIFPDLRVEYSETMRGRKCYVLMGKQPDKPGWKFFFDSDTGLLTRLIYYEDSPLGQDATQVDYADYREVEGVNIPFQQTTSRSNSRSVIRLESVQQNVPIDGAKFAIPAIRDAKAH